MTGPDTPNPPSLDVRVAGLDAAAIADLLRELAGSGIDVSQLLRPAGTVVQQIVTIHNYAGPPGSPPNPGITTPAVPPP